LVLSILVAASGIGSEIAFGQLLKREYLVARDDWVRDGRPMWWTWRPDGAPMPQWGFRTARWRWLTSTPGWLQTDVTARFWHAFHRVLMIVCLVSWAVLLWMVLVAAQ
jgi:hypothetical protein